MGRIRKVIDWIVNTFIILVDILYGFVIGMFSIAVFQDVPGVFLNWSTIGISIVCMIMFHAVTIAIKLFLRSYKD